VRDWSGLLKWMEETAAVAKRHGRRCPRTEAGTTCVVSISLTSSS